MKRMILCISIGASGGCDSGNKTIATYKQARIDSTKIKITRLSQEYTRWTLKYNEKCPDSLSQMLKKSAKNSKPDHLDAWDNAFIMKCDEAPNSSGFTIVSLGPDGKANTTDDIKSEK